MRPQSLLIFLLSSLWFSVFQPWGFFRDPDAFYHAKIGALLLVQGPLHTFPWLDLTDFHNHFADLHFLFHVLLTPFIKTFGMLPGTQIAAVLFAALCVSVFFYCLKKLSLPLAWFWTFLLATSSPFIIRMSLAKASPLAVAWFVLGLCAIAKRRPSWGFVAGLGFALTHGGWILLLGCQALFLAGEIIFRCMVEEKSFWSGIRSSSWFTALLTLAGTMVGTVLHPNFPTNLSSLWTAVFKIGIKTSYEHVTLGGEWLPLTLADLAGGLGPYLVVMVLLVFGFIFARKRGLDLERGRQAIAFGLLTGALVAVSLKSQRFVEYLVPALTIWFAVLADVIDLPLFFKEFAQACRETCGKYLRLFQIVAVSALLILVGSDGWKAYTSLHQEAYPFDAFAGAMQAITKEARPGDRVFHSDWDEFPMLFVQNDQVKYIVGLDPTFLYVANPALSDQYRDIIFGSATSTVYDRIKTQFSARFVFIDREDHAEFEKMVRTDPRFILLYEDPTSLAFRLDP